MSETRYMISDTAKKVGVEAHVLRYWEEELDMPVSRNEMGHRYYTKEDVQVFQNIKELKEQGFQLKALKILLPELRKGDVKTLEGIYGLKEGLNNQVGGADMHGDELTNKKAADHESNKDKAEVITTAEHQEEIAEVSANDKMQQFQMIIGNVVKQVLEDNNKALGKEVSNQVSDSVIKEMDYVMRVREEREEERYKKLDETIRNFQKSRQEVAAAQAEGEKQKKKKRGWFRKKKDLYEEIG